MENRNMKGMKFSLKIFFFVKLNNCCESVNQISAWKVIPNTWLMDEQRCHSTIIKKIRKFDKCQNVANKSIKWNIVV